ASAANGGEGDAGVIRGPYRRRLHLRIEGQLRGRTARQIPHPDILTTPSVAQCICESSPVWRQVEVANGSGLAERREYSAGRIKRHGNGRPRSAGPIHQ